MASGATNTQLDGGAHPASIPLDGFSNWKSVQIFTGNRSREWVRLQEKAGRFPRRVRLTQRTTLWPNRELHRWAADPIGYTADAADQQAA
ncbi:helix-turn-helix transcriptional regulator [Paraburkholderia kururiensis]|uniref:AlpA family phage regulatory protein n=1 Tax=Paraburkholderia kururiensis TaxID=984307 RepID=A0ABZ0WSB9_9BURK|nr:AlpA family phage regulatory protein [Paraburkholderia kururiensis]WQD80272.1 AlpA family phage regulatory protein [Paraburkholderia kururiensis]